MTPKEEASALVSSVFNLINDNKANDKKNDKVDSIEEQSLPELMKLHEMYLANFNLIMWVDQHFIYIFLFVEINNELIVYYC